MAQLGPGLGQATMAPSLVWFKNMEKRNVYGEWSRELFADAAVVQEPRRLVFVAGMGAEDPVDGHIHHPGDCAAQTKMAYAKVAAILADHGADMSNIVRVVAYLTDMRDKQAYEQELRSALGDTEPPPHTLIGVSTLAWPSMVVEVEVTAAV